MVTLYLYFNAALYALFAAWCTFAPSQTAKSVGYETFSRSGVSEYLVVYGGLQLGLGIFFSTAQKRVTSALVWRSRWRFTGRSSSTAGRRLRGNGQWRQPRFSSACSKP